MSFKVFILGRPGSGKTTAARSISKLAEARGLSALHLNDYDVLKQMFLADTEHRIFRPTAHHGFDVLDFSILDTALQELGNVVERYSVSKDIITIEFARDNYHQALQNFKYELLHDACFLYIDATFETCLRRIHNRVALPATEDDHPSLSDELFKIYYREDHTPYMLSDFSLDFHISVGQVGIIENKGSYESFLVKTYETLDTFLALIPSLSQAQRILSGSVS